MATKSTTTKKISAKTTTPKASTGKKVEKAPTTETIKAENSTKDKSSKTPQTTNTKATKGSATEKSKKGASENKSTSKNASDDQGKIVKAKKDAAKSLDDLFEDCLKDALWAENAIAEALPTMIKNANSKHLVDALKAHLGETKNQIKTLKAVFKSIGVKAEEEKCDAMAGILKEGEGILEETEAGPVRDAGIIAACQKVEHYEIASYGTMVAYAKLLKHQEAKGMLEEILKEEKAADKNLSKLALSEINAKADK